LPYEQKGYIIPRAMTSEPDSERSARARLRALLSRRPEPEKRNAHSRRYEVSATAERRWLRADQQERRRMLKDCGWL